MSMSPNHLAITILQGPLSGKIDQATNDTITEHLANNEVARSQVVHMCLFLLDIAEDCFNGAEGANPLLKGTVRGHMKELRGYFESELESHTEKTADLNGVGARLGRELVAGFPPGDKDADRVVTSMGYVVTQLAKSAPGNAMFSFYPAIGDEFVPKVAAKLIEVLEGA